MVAISQNIFAVSKVKPYKKPAYRYRNIGSRRSRRYIAYKQYNTYTSSDAAWVKSAHIAEMLSWRTDAFAQNYLL